MRIKIFTILLAIITMSVQAQKVIFVSEGFKAGVKDHLGLSDKDEIIQAQTDTITAIDLSGREIVDISDVASLPNVTWIDLGENKIEDVSPLASLEHLHYVNLRKNALETINPLVFACTDSLHVNVADNYIKDYDYLFSVTSCHLLLEGIGAQQEKDAPYFDVYQLYADINETGAQVVCYRGFTNMENDATLACGSMSFPAVMDGYTNSVTLLSDVAATTQAILSNGEVGDTTYIVPIADYTVAAGESVILETGLPEDYLLSYAYAMKGAVEIEGNTMKYTAPATAEGDIVDFCYYRGSTLKGFSRYCLNKDILIDGIDILKGKNVKIDIALQENMLRVKCSANTLASESIIEVCDIAGRVIASKHVDSAHGIDEQIPLPWLPHDVIIVKVSSGKERFIGKYVMQ